MSLINGIMWIIALFMALAYYDVTLKYLNSIKPPAIPTAPPLPKAAHLNNISSIKSDNCVPSTAEEQIILRRFEEKLIEFESESATSATSAIKAVSDDVRWKNSVYSPISSLPDSSYFDLTRVILCSTGIKFRDNSCEGIRELVKNSLFGLKTDKRIIFGFRMLLEREPVSAAKFRIKIHDHFLEKLWPKIKEIIDFEKENREIILVGYESGGALATLTAWHCIKEFESVKPTGFIVTNGNNQIKVVTWDELPLFSHQTAQKSPILSHNHSRYISTNISESIYRKIAQSSGGIDEIQYFSTSGDAIYLKPEDYSKYSTKLPSKTSKLSSDDWNPLPHLPQFINKKHLRNFSQDKIEKLTKILILHHQHLKILHDLISNHFHSYIIESLLIEPNSCAQAIATQLSSTIFPNSSINCRVNDLFVDDGSFEIHCSYKSTNNKNSIQFLSFGAILGDEKNFRENNNCAAFMIEDEVVVVETDESAEDGNGAKRKKKSKKSKEKGTEKIVKVKKYFGPSPVYDSWSNCLYDLFEQSPHLSIISPYEIRKKSVYPRCSYIPFASYLSNSKGNTGCYFRSTNVAQELIQLSRSDPNFFYKIVEPRNMEFPQRCKQQLFNIPFKANEKLELESLQQLAVDYLTEIVDKQPLADTEVTLWKPRDTNSFITDSFVGTSRISLEHLANRKFYEPDFENLIIKCLSNPSYPYRDCTNPINQWIPAACPSACTQTHGTISFLCKQVKSCPAASYYISISSEGTLEQLKEIQTVLNKKPNPQFGIFHVINRARSYFRSGVFNVALFRMPLRN